MLKKLLILLSLLVFSVSVYANDKVVTGAGASFPYPVYSTWAYMYKQATGVSVNYQSIGSGGGIKQISAKTVDFGATDDPLTVETLKGSNLIQFPTVIGAIVVIVNIDGVKNNELTLSGEIISSIFMGKIKTWSDPAIKKLNPNVKLPDTKITVVHRSDSSGTTAVFTNYLSGVSSDWKNKMGVGKSIDWTTGIGGKGNDGVAASVKQIKNSIGYVEYSYASQNGIVYATLINKAGKKVEANYESFVAATKGVVFDSKKGYNVWLTNASGDNSYPIVAGTFILLRLDDKKAAAKTLKFFEWSFANGDDYAKKLLYVPLPATVKADVLKYIKAKIK